MRCEILSFCDQHFYNDSYSLNSDVTQFEYCVACSALCLIGAEVNS